MIYNDFAQFYDVLTSDIDYSKWADYILSLYSKFSENKNKPALIAELACGTGNVTIEILKRNCDVIGIDFSESMLSIARQKLDIAGFHKILLLKQDISKLDLFGSVDAVICCLDGLNYLTKTDALLQCFERVKTFLKPEGLFIFDMNSEYKFANIFAKNAYTYDYFDEGIYCVWQNDYNENTKICDFYLTFFQESESGLYRRYDEHHRERAYSQKHIKTLLKKAGFTPLAILDEFEEIAPRVDSQRIFYIAKKEIDING